MLDPGQVLLFGHSPAHSTRFERGEIERLGLARIGLDDVRGDPDGAARQASSSTRCSPR
jgi:arginase